MPFNFEKFRVANYQDRTERIPVPVLQYFFDEGEEAVWVVRGLSASEVFMSNEAANVQKTIDEVLASIETNESKVSQIREIMGIDMDLSPTFVRKLNLFLLGTVQPKVNPRENRDIALLIEKRHPAEFLRICEVINSLSGQGMDLKKSKPSGQTAK